LTMIDRESAQKLLKVLQDADDTSAGRRYVGDLLQDSLRSLLEDQLGLKRRQDLPGESLRDRLELFFRETIEVAPFPPVAYTAQEVAQLARHSFQQTIDRMKEASESHDPEEKEMVTFYSGISSDYNAIAIIADTGALTGAIRAYKKLDTADRENFGWGADIWDEARWAATLVSHLM
jgi:hypothetical protein